MKLLLPLFLVVFISACSQSQDAKKMDTFPTIPAQTLSKEDIVFPDVLEGQQGFIAVAFKQKAQQQIDSWTALLIDSLQERGVVFYEIPMISGAWKPLSGWIDGGMRSGIATEKHPFVATYYGPLKKFKAQLGVDDDQLAYFYLIDPEGKILFRGQGFAKQSDVDRVLAAIE